MRKKKSNIKKKRKRKKKMGQRDSKLQNRYMDDEAKHAMPWSAGNSSNQQQPWQPVTILKGDDKNALLNLHDIATKINNGSIKKIIVMAGAGISTASGIPDFRTPGKGLYDNLQKYNIPTPQSIFNLEYFRSNPEPFYTLAKELFPDETKYKPTETHRFIKMLADRNLLLRCYTQNIDGLEKLAGIPENLIVQVHGDFSNGHCIDCGKETGYEPMKQACQKGEILRCPGCLGLTKPDIVFFGENLSSEFFYCIKKDFPQCDCLIVLGTSLQVKPFALLIGEVWPQTPRLLLNREMCGLATPENPKGFLFGDSTKNDIFVKGECDDGVRQILKLIQ